MSDENKVTMRSPSHKRDGRRGPYKRMVQENGTSEPYRRTYRRTYKRTLQEDLIRELYKRTIEMSGR